MRSKKAFLNIAASIIELIAATVASFVVPHYIIHHYGSSVNGLLSSITQFLSYIALIESGIGPIGRASLYKPLAEKDASALSSNVKAIENFYRKISYIFIAYLVVLTVLFPFLISGTFSWAYTAILIVILAFSIFIQYFFGITYQTVIQADQRKYVVLLLQAFTLFLNMLITIILVEFGAGIHVAQFVSAAAYAIRPLILHSYVKRFYNIDSKAAPNMEILKQRWDGVAQHISFFVHKNTDIAVLTILSSIKEVSVYSVYMLAVSGCSKVVNIFSSSLEPAFGNMIANGEEETLKARVRFCSALTIQITIILFSTAAIIISPFIRIYTRGVTDIDYLRPIFGIIMLIAESFYCVRLPYQSAIYAAGHFRQTRNGAILEAVINVVCSIALVYRYGLIGVAIGTLLAMLFRTCQYIWYYHIKLIQDKAGLYKELTRAIVFGFEIILIWLVSHVLPPVSSAGYLEWILSSCTIGIICSFIICACSYVFFREEFHELISLIKIVLSRKQKGKA